MFHDLLSSTYCGKIPAFLRAAADTAPMRRLQSIGMNCGCEYTAFPRFARLGSYSRFDHSFGASLIVWHFTQDRAQALAALLHDISAPVFSHVIDFLRGDYLSQEATEAGTEEIIRSDPELQALLLSLGLRTEDVSDYHRYPIADNDSPQLSADRLEYSLGNMLNYRIRPAEAVVRMYRDLTVSENEDGAPELTFLHPDIALDFSFAALACAEIYVSDEDRYSMQILAELIRDAVSGGVIRETDLYGTEPDFIAKLNASPVFCRRWTEFCAMNCIERSETNPGGMWRLIPAKKRCIDPLITGVGRASAIDADFRASLTEFRLRSQNYWVRGTVIGDTP